MLSHSGRSHPALKAWLCPEQCTCSDLSGKVGEPGPVAGVWMSSELVPMSSLTFLFLRKTHHFSPRLLIMPWAQGLATSHGGSAESSFLLERWELEPEVVLCESVVPFTLKSIGSDVSIHWDYNTNGDGLFSRQIGVAI